MKAAQLRLEFGAEVAVLDIVDGAMEAVLVAHRHAAAPGAQVGVIVRAVVQIGDAIAVGDNPEKTAHDDLELMECKPSSAVSGGSCGLAGP